MLFTELPLKKRSDDFFNCVRFCIWGSSPYNPKNNKKSKVDKSTLDFLVRWKGLSSKYTPCLNNFAEQNRNKHFVCFSSPHKVKDFVGTPK